MSASSDFDVYDGVTGKLIKRNRMEELWDQLHSPIRWSGLILSLILGLWALGIALDTRGKLENVLSQLSVTATPIVTDTPTPLPTATLQVSLIPLSSISAGICQGTVRVDTTADYHRAPSLDAPVMGSLAQFQRVNIMHKNGNFVFVEVGTRSGWMLDFQIQFDDPTCINLLPTATPS